MTSTTFLFVLNLVLRRFTRGTRTTESQVDLYKQRFAQKAKEDKFQVEKDSRAFLTAEEREKATDLYLVL